MSHFLLRWMCRVIVLMGCLLHQGTVAQGQTLVLEEAQTAGMSMFRAHWDDPIPLAEGGVRAAWNNPKFFKDGRGQYAVWSRDKRNGQPGAIAFDALNRSLLVRFPDAAERIAAELNQGKKIVKVELVLPFLDEEFFPPAPGQDYPGPDSYNYKSTFGTYEAWEASRPTWHAIAHALRKPWKSDETLGPTFNAAINGALYWKKYGAQDPQEDRVDKTFGPAEVSYKKTEGRLDVTAALTDPAFGKTLAERLRNFADNGFVVRKWETYDHRYYNGVYEAPTATGGRGILTKTPQLAVTFAPGGAEKVGTLPPPVDVPALAATLKGTPQSGAPTAVLPTLQEIEKWAGGDAVRPKWADDTQWARIQELLKLQGHGEAAVPFWENFVPVFVLDRLRKYRLEKGEKIYETQHTPEQSYKAWVDILIARPVRGWSGFEVAREYAEWQLGQKLLPGPAKDAILRYWTAWLMPDRVNASASRRRDPTLFDGTLVHPMVEHPGVTKGAVHPDPSQGRFDSYWQATGDWRGNKSFYRSGFCYDISTQNFNTSASVGAFVFSGLIGSELARADGVNGVDQWLVKGWTWNDGSGQEHFDHYYYSVTLAGLKTLQNAAQDPATRLLADGLVTKGMEEAIAAWHPRLKRFIGPAARTSLEFLLGTQEGGNFIMHSLSRKGMLTDVGVKRLPGKIPVIGHDLPPNLVGLLSLPSPWADEDMAALVDEKAVGWEATHRGAGTWRRSWVGQHYGLASQLAATGRIQAMAQWRRADREVTSALDLGTLDIRGGLNETRWVNEQGGWISQPFKQVIAQGKNRWLAVMNPSGVAGRENVQSIQYSLGLFDIRESGPTWEIYLDGKKAESLPVTAKQGQAITIRDGVTFLSIVPLPATDLGRDAEVVIKQGQPQEYKQYGATFGPAVVIDSYLYKKEAALPKDADPQAVRRAYAGFALEVADASETTFEAFQKKAAQTKVEAAFDPATRHLKVASTSGGETLEMVVETAPADGAKPDALAKFDPKVISATLGGEPLYPVDGRNILRDTPVTQMAWDRAEKGGARVETMAGTYGIRVFLQSFPEQGRFTMWNPQGVPTGFRYSLPGGGMITADGQIGLTRIRVDLPGKKIEIDHARQTGRESDPTNGAATAFLVTGFPNDVSIHFNGAPALQNPNTLQVESKSWKVVPIDPAVKIRSAGEISALWEQMEAVGEARAKAEVKSEFVQMDFAGPFPQAEGVYGPEKNPGAKITRNESYPGGLEGAEVKWRNFGQILRDHEPLQEPRKGAMNLFTAHNAPSTAPCTYYLHAVARSARAQEVRLDLTINAWPDASPEQVKLWVNGKEHPITQGKQGLARVPLTAGENTILVKIRQEDVRNPKSADQVSIFMGDPTFGAPLLNDVEWRTVQGNWVPVNPKKR